MGIRVQDAGVGFCNVGFGLVQGNLVVYAGHVGIIFSMGCYVR